MISFRCGQCGKELKVKDELAGKKVKCPGCQKPAAVPQLAASLSPSPIGAGGPGEEKTLAAKAPAGAEELTVPPKNRSQADRESLSDAGGGTALGGGHKGDVTQGLPAEGPSPELTSFLAPAEKPDEIGRLGPYRVLKVLGAGGMGVVFKAEDPGLQRLVALKAMLPSLAGSPSAKERFFREAKAAAALKHPHIVTIHQVGEDRGAPFLAMEFLEGEALDDRLKRDKKLPLPDLLRIGCQVADGLAAAHERGLIHRDIKPANIWLEKVKVHGVVTTNAKILDFGLARALADQTHLTQQGAIIGTPAYMAPEQAGGKPVDHRCDLFSLGCLLYRLATGQMAFKGDDTISILSAIALESPAPPAELNPVVPHELSDLIMTLLAKKAEDRPFSAHEVAKALRELERDGGDKTLQTTRKPSTAVKKARTENTAAMPKAGAGRKKRLLLGLGGGLAAALALGIVIFWQTPHGLVKIESNSPAVEIVFDKTGPTIKGASKEPISLRVGQHAILIKYGDFSFETDKILIEKNKITTLKIELRFGKMQIAQDGKVIAAKELPGKEDTVVNLPKTFTNDLGIEFVLVPKGKSWLGGGGGKPGDKEVEITHDFYLGKYEVTQEEWEKVMGKNPSYFSRTGAGKGRVQDIGDAELKRFPVEMVSWDDAQLFLEQLNKREKAAGWIYRLPKEAEWEVASRGGPLADKAESAFDFYFDKPTHQLQPEQANFGHGKGLSRTCKVGSFRPNKLGLHDMHGNVCEWCDEKAADGANRLLRGGQWDGDAANCRSANRSVLAAPAYKGTTSGFRLARVPVGKEIVKVAAEEKLPTTFKNDLGIEFVLVPKGKSWLGGGSGKPGTQEVEVAHDFYLGKYEVTQEEWEKVTGSNPSHFKAVDQKRFPVEMVSWEDCQAFIKRLNEKVKEAGWLYRLPKEAEWEYACRGGPLGDRLDSAFDFYFEKPTNQLLPEQANFEHGQALKRTCKVGSYKPNRLGLCDMHGNVYEWCEELYDPKDAKAGAHRVLRGGSLHLVSGGCRAASRDFAAPSSRIYDIGLRLARVPVGKEIVKTAAEEKKPPLEAKLPPTFKNDLGIEFVLVPKGKSWLGGGGGKPGTKQVEIAHDYYLGKYEVTQEEWEKVTGLNPSSFKAVPGVGKEEQKRFPVETVSWEDAQEFIKRLNEKMKDAGWVYRLPKEAEWEYACRDGPLGDKFDSAFDYYFEKPTKNIYPTDANFKNVFKRTCKAGTFKPNRLGLYDMHGNVWEWCEDFYDPKDPKTASFRVLRGGSWEIPAEHCRASYRAYQPLKRYGPIGLRLARVPAGKEIVKIRLIR